jgi:hypothetical protein
MKLNFCLFLFSISLSANAQFTANISKASHSNAFVETHYAGYSYSSAQKKIFQRNHGIILGLQRGKSTAIEMGGEAHCEGLHF